MSRRVGSSVSVLGKIISDARGANLPISLLWNGPLLAPLHDASHAMHTGRSARLLVRVASNAMRALTPEVVACLDRANDNEPCDIIFLSKTIDSLVLFRLGSCVNGKDHSSVVSSSSHV
jgi:hypothetical protein